MPGAKDTAKILSHLRGLMREVQIAEVAGGLSAYIVPSSDAHSSEYISERDKRRQFVSGFTGSAGTAVITQDKALLWTDGRYFLQASQELDEANWQLMKDGLVETPSIGEWLCRNLPTSSVVGIDTTLYEEDLYLSLANKLRENRLRLFHTKQNLVDLVWNNRPLQELKPLIQLNISDYGKSTQEKLKSIREQMKSLNVYATVVTSLDEIAWLLNIRGFDIPYGAVFFAYALITETNLKVFTDLTRLDSSSPTIRQDLCQQAGENLEFGEYGHFYQFIEEFMSKEIVQANRKVFLSGQTNHFIHSLVPHDLVHKDMSLVNKLKIIKNANEIEAAKRVHVRDSVTLVELFYKLDKQFDPNSNNRNHFDGMELTELSVSDYLDQFRATKPGFLTPSFETICGFGSNGAIIHYKPHPNEKNKTIESNNLLLIDSGGHYSDMGTTDVTRTVYLGDKSTISDYQRECFTRVLKGHIQLALRIFPVNTRSELLDSFARQALWNVGLDYSHGTGHGVGALLNVHEVPIIGNRKSIELGLQENMIVTIEPGYYENDKFGIRIENCVLAVKAAKKYKYASNVDFLTFEPLTYVPIQRELIDKSLLDADELNWLNSYHTKCAELIGPELKKAGQNDVYEWLLEQTKPI